MCLPPDASGGICLPRGRVQIISSHVLYMQGLWTSHETQGIVTHFVNSFWVVFNFRDKIDIYILA